MSASQRTSEQSFAVIIENERVVKLVRILERLKHRGRGRKQDFFHRATEHRFCTVVQWKKSFRPRPRCFILSSIRIVPPPRMPGLCWTPLKTWSVWLAIQPKVAQGVVIQFLTAEGYHTVDIHRRMQVMYGANCVSKTTVNDWVQMYWEGREETKNLPEQCWDYVLETEAVDKTDRTIREDHRQRLRSLAEKFAMSFGTPMGV